MSLNGSYTPSLAILDGLNWVWAKRGVCEIIAGCSKWNKNYIVSLLCVALDVKSIWGFISVASVFPQP
jgi:hypothetical protein